MLVPEREQVKETLPCSLETFTFHQSFPGGSEVKASAWNAGDPDSFHPWVGKIPWRRKWPQPLGKADLEDIFSGVVSMELGPRPETQSHRGRKTTWTSLCSPGDL